jgi:hypothetical protein
VAVYVESPISSATEILGDFAQSRQAPTICFMSVRPSVGFYARPSECISAALTERISVKCDIGDFYENLSTESRFG